MSEYNSKERESLKAGFGKVAASEKLHEITSGGAFVRQKNRFDLPFKAQPDPGEVAFRDYLPVEKGRYRLIWTSLCPWATRQKIALSLLGIGEDVISIGKTAPVRTPRGWEFSLDEGGVDPVLRIRFLGEAYAKADPEYDGRATVPAVVDVTTGKVVNNDYHHLTNYWETEWKAFQRKDAPDLYPKALRHEIDEMNEILFNEVNNGVYKAGFAESQEEYEKNYHLVFNRLDDFEKRLGESRFLFGDTLTDSDIRLYVTLARFDTAYYFAFRLNRCRIRDYDNLWNYAKELYSIPAFRSATDFDSIKRGYLMGNHETNPWRILPKGPDNSEWEEPNNRSVKFGKPRYDYWKEA